MSNCRNFLQSPFFFIVSSLQAADDHDTESNRIDCHRSTAGTVVQSLHKLKDVDGSGKKKKILTPPPAARLCFHMQKC